METPKFSTFLRLTLGSWIWVNFLACSTTEVVPRPAPSPPAYTQVPHPRGYASSDLEAIFTDPKAMKLELLKECDGLYRELKKLTQSKDELSKGVREMVANDPITYHWCFYGKLLILDRDLKQESFIEEKQKKILQLFEFLVPLAKGFMTLFHDSRYYRQAVHKYKSLSERVFYRKLELTPEGTSELVESSNPFGVWRELPDETSVLAKYHLITIPTPSAKPSPEQVVPADKETLK